MTLMTLLTILWPSHFQFTFFLHTVISWLGMFQEAEIGTQFNEECCFVFSAFLG